MLERPQSLKDIAATYSTKTRYQLLVLSFSTKTLDIDGKTVNLYIWDTAGDERFSSMSTSYIHGSDGLVLVYDSLKADFNRVFNFLTLFREGVKQDNPESIPVLVLGNKIDMVKENENEMEELEKIESEISKFCSFHGITDYSLVSAKEDIGIDEGFETITRKMIANIKNAENTPKIVL